MKLIKTQKPIAINHRIRKTNKITGIIHNGNVIIHQDHATVSVSFKTRKIINKTISIKIFILIIKKIKRFRELRETACL